MQKMKILVPPSFGELWEDEVFRSAAERKPKLPDNLKFGEPWLLVVHRAPNSNRAPWAHKQFSDYFDALDFGLEQLDEPGVDDMAVVSKRRLFRPPLNLVWPYRYTWCGRCRRPTLFRPVHKQHHALRKAPAGLEVACSTGDRCYYCGLRKSYQPEYPMRFSK